MPRAANGTYTLPVGNPVVTNTPISSTVQNTTMSDVAAALSDSLSRSGLGGMLAALPFASGTVSAPGITWSTESVSGFYLAGANDMRATIGGVEKMRWNAAGVYVGGGAYTPTESSTRVFGVVSLTGRVASGVQSLSASLNRAELFADDSPVAVGIDWTYQTGLAKFEFRRAGVEVFNYTQNNINLVAGNTLRWYDTGDVDFGYIYRTTGGLGMFDSELLTFYVNGATRFSVTPTYLECSLNMRHLSSTLSLWYNAGNTTYAGIGVTSANRLYANENGTARGAIMHWEVNTLPRGTIKISTTAPTSGSAGEMVLVYE